MKEQNRLAKLFVEYIGKLYFRIDPETFQKMPSFISSISDHDT